MPFWIFLYFFFATCRGFPLHDCLTLQALDFHDATHVYIKRFPVIDALVTVLKELAVETVEQESTRQKFVPLEVNIAVLVVISSVVPTVDRAYSLLFGAGGGGLSTGLDSPAACAGDAEAQAERCGDGGDQVRVQGCHLA